LDNPSTATGIAKKRQGFLIRKRGSKNMMDEKKLARDELIGRHVTIKECTDPTWINRSGMIIDETKNTFLIDIDGKERRIAKKTAKFEFEYNGKKLMLDGSKLVYRPEDRTKKIR